MSRSVERRYRLVRVLLLAAGTLLVCAPELWACPVCFGASDAPAARGMNLAVFFMLGLIGLVLTGFASFFLYLMKRARAFRRAEEDWTEGIVGSEI